MACEPSGVTPAGGGHRGGGGGREARGRAGGPADDGALAGPLRQALPGATLLDAVTCEQGFSVRRPRRRRAADSTPGRFTVGIVAVDGAGVGPPRGWVARAPAPAGRGCAGDDDGATCVREEQQDGTVVYRARVDHGGGAVLLMVDTYRPDGGHVQLEAATSLQPVTPSR